MKLKQFSFEKFRSIQSRIKLPIHEISILIGQNGAGKTTTLDALELFFITNLEINHADINGIVLKKTLLENLEIIFNGVFHITEEEKKFFKTYNGDLEGEEIIILKKFIPKNVDSYYFIHTSGTGTELDNLELGRLSDPYRKLCRKFDVEISEKTTVSQMKIALQAKSKEFPQDKKIEKIIEKKEISKLFPNYIRFSSEGSLDPKREMIKILTKTLKDRVNELKIDKPITKITQIITNVCHEKINEASKLIEKYCKDIQRIEINPTYDALSGLKLEEFNIIKRSGDKVRFESEATGKRKQIMMGLYEWSNLQITENMDSNFLIAFDEPDLHFDYIQITNLLKILKDFSKKSNVQVLIVTHSIKLIDNFKPNQIIHFKFNEKDETEPSFLTDDDFNNFGSFLKEISFSLGFRSAFLFFEKIFVITEGDSEFKAFPILFELINEKTHIEAGILFINAEDNIQALKFAKFLRDNKKEVILIVDRDSKKKKDFKETNLNKLGFRENQNFYFVGEKDNPRGEFETEFTSDQWTNMLNLNYQKKNGTIWVSKNIDDIKNNTKFSKELIELVEEQCNERVSKPILAVNISKSIKKNELSKNLKNIITKLNSISESI